jgi:ABC-type uncharacterized transport system substrate-binding protein
MGPVKRRLLHTFFRSASFNFRLRLPPKIVSERVNLSSIFCSPILLALYSGRSVVPVKRSCISRALAADLVRRQVAVIAANTPAALPAKAVTATIPIVFLTAADPVEAGLVASLNRPGGNLTGMSILNVELGPKRLELLHELVPSASIVALLINPTHPAAATASKDLQAAARTLGLEFHVLHASTEHDFDTVFATLAQVGAGALVIGADAFFVSRSEQLVQQITKVELIINLKTARALGLTVSLPLLGRADEVIE